MEMEGVVLQCRTGSEGRGAHRSDREPPEHSSDTQRGRNGIILTRFHMFTVPIYI